MQKIVYYISQIFMIFLGSNQRGMLNTGVKSRVKIVYLKVKARRKIEYMCQSRGEICLSKIAT